MFHSTARSTQGAQITTFKPSDGKVTIVDPVPVGSTRHFGLTTANKSSAYGIQPPAMGFQSFDPAAMGLLSVYIKDASGQLYLIASAPVIGAVLMSSATVLLAPGESIVVEADPGTVASKIYAMAWFVDLQGPFEHKRTPITDDWQDVIPSPLPGRLHTPIGSFQIPVFINGYVVKKDSAGGSIKLRVMVDGSPFGTEGISGASPGVIVPLCPSLPALAPLQGVIPLPEGWSIQAKKDAGSGAIGAVAFASYLVTDNPAG